MFTSVGSGDQGIRGSGDQGIEGIRGISNTLAISNFTMLLSTYLNSQAEEFRGNGARKWLKGEKVSEGSISQRSGWVHWVDRLWQGPQGSTIVHSALRTGIMPGL